MNTTRHALVAFLAVTSLAISACAAPTGGGTEGQEANATAAPKAKYTIKLVAPEAGLDYPTDAPAPASLASKKVLAINEYDRILVNKGATLDEPTAGEDFPTDSAMPKHLEGKKVLVLDPYHRVVIDLRNAEAGVDYPTDLPAGSSWDTNFTVWAFSETHHAPLNKIFAIEMAEAGVDYPTDSPQQKYYVVVTRSADGSTSRTRIGQ